MNMYTYIYMDYIHIHSRPKVNMIWFQQVRALQKSWDKSLQSTNRPLLRSRLLFLMSAPGAVTVGSGCTVVCSMARVGDVDLLP